MRLKFFSVLFLAMMVVAFSCDNASGLTGSNSGSEDSLNLAAANKIWHAYETGEVAKLDSVVSTSFTDHSLSGDKRGIDSLKLNIRWMHDNITGMQMEKEREWVDGDYVGQWMHLSGTNVVTGGGFPIGEFMIRGIDVLKFHDGKAVEHWFFYDSQTVTDIISRLQSRGAPAAVPDSTSGAADSLQKADSLRKK